MENPRISPYKVPPCLQEGSHRSNAHSTLKRSVRFFFPPLFALFYATLLASLPVDAFADRYNYLAYAASSDLILQRYTTHGVTFTLANEPLWLLINIWLEHFLSPPDVVRTIIFVPSFLTAYLLLRNNPNNILWAILFLAIPLVVKNHIIHLRQGVGISVFLLGYYARSRTLKNVTMWASPFLHSSFFFVLLIKYLSDFLTLFRPTPTLRLAIYSLVFLALAVVLEAISTNLGARQAIEHMRMETDASGLGFVFWAGILMLFLSYGRDFITKHAFPLAALVFYLSVYFLLPVSGRIFESAVLLVLTAGLNLTGLRRLAFLAGVVSFVVISYALQINQPWLGWGAF